MSLDVTSLNAQRVKQAQKRSDGTRGICVLPLQYALYFPTPDHQ